jgi:group I intron endonuclease
MTLCGIYKIHNRINGKVYIGQTQNNRSRWYVEKRLGGPNQHLRSSIAKYGLENFEFSMLLICPSLPALLDAAEIACIQLYQSTDLTKGYNKKSGGSHGQHSPETRAKISTSLRRFRREQTSEYWKARAIKAGLSLKGKKKESSENMHAPKSEEHRQAIAAGQRAAWARRKALKEPQND